jgi:hypothetical protein
MVIVRRTLETTLERHVVLDAPVRSLKLMLRHDAGWPDRLWLFPERPLWSEFKRPGADLDPLQRSRLDYLASLGYDVAVFNSYDIAMERLHATYRQRMAQR